LAEERKQIIQLSNRMTLSSTL